MTPHLLQDEDEVAGQHVGGVAAGLAAEDNLAAMAVPGLHMHLPGGWGCWEGEWGAQLGSGRGSRKVPCALSA